MRAHNNRQDIHRPREGGFTLAEVLLTGALAAVLLTALAHSTMEFGYSIAYLEDKAGTADAQDSVLRRLTRDIREAWWAEVVSDTHIKLADEDGEYTEYWLQGDALWLRRPNGDEGLVFDDVEHLEFVAITGDRNREGPGQQLNASWYSQPTPLSPALPLESAEAGMVALTFSPPLNAAAAGGSDSEELIEASLDTLSVAVSWVPVSEEIPGELTVSLYETRGPGKPKTVGGALAALVVPGGDLPAAVDAGGWWEVPELESVMALAAPEGLDPGRGYAVVLQASAGASFVVPAHSVVPAVSKDLIGTKDAGFGSNWVELPMVVPFSLTGVADVTSTVTQQMVETISVTLQQNNRPQMTRSASVLSQTLGESAWLGVVPGESAP
jgi:hypothetical protein